MFDLMHEGKALVGDSVGELTLPLSAVGGGEPLPELHLVYTDKYLEAACVRFEKFIMV